MDDDKQGPTAQAWATPQSPQNTMASLKGRVTGPAGALATHLPERGWPLWCREGGCEQTPDVSGETQAKGADKRSTEETREWSPNT